jgi:hypothetical protein
MSNLMIALDAMLDGMSGAGLFGRLRRPGAPTHLIDPRSLEELKASGEFDATVSRFKAALGEKADDDRRRASKAAAGEGIYAHRP